MNYQINNIIDLHKDIDLEDEWGYFIDIDNNNDEYNYEHNDEYNDNNLDNYFQNYNYNEENILKASNMIIKISSTTLLTIGVTYLILSIL